MIAIQEISEAPLSCRITGFDEDLFQVIRYRGQEGLCQLYRFEIDLVCTQEQIEFDAVVGKAAALTINTPSGRRWFHGIISRFEMTGETVEQVYYRAELVPEVWLLTHRYDSRIFQNKTVQAIISDVLTRAGIPNDRVKISLSGSHSVREYCVQYRETDYNFICRLMEEEGIWWCFQQTEDAHILFLADSPSAYEPIDDDAQLPYQPPTGMNVETEHVFRFRLGQCVRPGTVVLNDFSFEKPSLDLKARADAGRDQDLEFNDYPGEYSQQASGTNLAKLRVQEFESGRVLGVGQSNSHRLSPGLTFELIEHPSARANGEYLLTSVIHQGRQSISRTFSQTDGQAGLWDPTAHQALAQWGYHAGQASRHLPSPASFREDVASEYAADDAPVYACRFECIPAQVAFRPPRITPWPVMRGTQTARVVGPASEEIHTDQYGRVKVQFNWDREGRFDDKSSCWIRVASGLAGGAYGMLFLPHVGQEVIVDFLEGDPDKPIIIGRVYNADHMPAYPLPAEKTKSYIKTSSSTGGGGTNEIRFEDLKGSEQVLIHAEKDLHLRVKNDQVETVEHDRHLTVEANQFELVKQSKSSEVTLDRKEKVGGKLSLEVAGDVGEDFKCNHGQKVGSAYSLKAGGSVVIEGGTDLTLVVGGNFIKIDSSGITILGTKVDINSGGSAGVASPVALQAPVAPIPADTAAPGRDKTYAPGATPPAQPPAAPKKTSWIEIELVDEMGQPWPSEPYEIVAPDGKTIKRGSLDKLGQAHVELENAGNCQICFPHLDTAAWYRAGTQPPAGAGPAAAGTSPTSGAQAGPQPGSPAATTPGASAGTAQGTSGTSGNAALSGGAGAVSSSK